MSAKRTSTPSHSRVKANAPTRGRADLDRIRRVSDATIRRTAPIELPEFPADFWDGAELVIPEKIPISLRVDSDILDWFRSQGPKYQSRMNAVLRSYMRNAGKQSKTRPD